MLIKIIFTLLFIWCRVYNLVNFNRLYSRAKNNITVFKKLDLLFYITNISYWIWVIYNYKHALFIFPLYIFKWIFFALKIPVPKWYEKAFLIINILAVPFIMFYDQIISYLSYLR